ncbi:MAG TPA: AAA family ATPase, partial [Gemmataceae bacterium]|nr:AAA family ATPase [Gemmataceae bacterium]
MVDEERNKLRERGMWPSVNGDGKHADEKLEPVIRRVEDVKKLPVEWLWNARVPRGMVSLCDGDPGCGKSTLSCDLAARVSRGWAMPSEPADGQVKKPAGVLLLNAEDDPERTIRPRLDAASADVKRVHILTAIRLGADDERPPVLPYDLPLIEDFIRDEGIALVVVDPFMAFLA